MDTNNPIDTELQKTEYFVPTYEKNIDFLTQKVKAKPQQAKTTLQARATGFLSSLGSMMKRREAPESAELLPVQDEAEKYKT